MCAAYWDDSSDDVDDYEDRDALLEDEEGTDTVLCPECGADVYEDADQCPVCGMFMVPDTRFWSGKPLWWIALGFLGLIALAAALVIGF